MIYLIVALILLTNYLAFKLGKDFAQKKLEFKLFKYGIIRSFHAAEMGLVDEIQYRLKPRKGKELALGLFLDTTSFLSREKISDEKSNP